MKQLKLVANGEFKISSQSLKGLKSGTCRVKIAYTGICSSDVDRGFGHGAYFYPLVMGHEIAGFVTRQSLDVSKDWLQKQVVVFPLKPCFSCVHCLNKKYMRCADYSYYGSRTDGGFADYLDVNEWNLLEVPQRTDMKDACLTEPCAVVNHAINQLDNKLLSVANCRVGIIGAGFLGLVASDLIKEKNHTAEIIVIDRNQFKLDFLKNGSKPIKISNDEERLGFENNYKNYFDIMLEATGTVMSVNTCVACAKPGSSIVLMGNMKDDLKLSKNEIDKIIRSELTITGTWNSDFKGYERDDWLEIINLYQKGFRPSAYVTDVVSLSEIPNILHERFQHKNGIFISNILKAIFANV